MYYFVQRKPKLFSLFLKNSKQNEHNQQQQNNAPQVVSIFVVVVENYKVIFFEEMQSMKRNSLYTEWVHNRRSYYFLNLRWWLNLWIFDINLLFLQKPVIGLVNMQLAFVSIFSHIG